MALLASIVCTYLLLLSDVNGQLTQDEKTYIVQYHNERRATVGASNMNYLVSPS